MSRPFPVVDGLQEGGADKLIELISTTNNWITTHILVVMLIGAGIYFTIRIGFVQTRLFGQMARQVFDSRDADGNGISSFQAFAIGIVSQAGTGNIAGVAIAAILGGPGAVLWMRLVVFLGMATAFVEATLTQLFKIRQHDGALRGGPVPYIQRGPDSCKRGVVFTLFLIYSFGVFFKMIQANMIADTLKAQFEVNPWVMVTVLLALCGPIVHGGLKAVARASEIVAPLMAIAYIGLAAAVVAINLDKVGPTFSLTVENVFGLRETLGGLAGSMTAAMMNGIKCGLLSNEVGKGPALNAVSIVHITHPAKQGLIQSAGVFVDTTLVCSATAFIFFNTDPEAPKPYWISPDPAGTDITIAALKSTLEAWAGPVMIVLICVFAGSLAIGNFTYAEVNMDLLTKGRAWGDKLLRAIAIVSIVPGFVAELKLIWSFADLTMMGIALINIVSIVMLDKRTFGALQDYLRNRERPFTVTGNPSMPGEPPTDIRVYGGTDSPSGSLATAH